VFLLVFGNFYRFEKKQVFTGTASTPFCKYNLLIFFIFLFFPDSQQIGTVFV